MSRIIYTTTGTGPKWSSDNVIFTTVNLDLDGQSNREGHLFGASCASALLGPDLKMPEGGTNNPPSIGGYPWDTAPPVFMGGPDVTFVEDATFTWIRGHLVNGRWGGPGDTWENLTPLTSTANHNHSSIEAYMDRFLSACHSYENGARRDYWYGLYYAVQCSANCFAHAPAEDDLYSYAPAYIKVTWRAVSVIKPVNRSVEDVRANPLLAGNPQAVNAFPVGFVLPDPPDIQGWPVAVLPAGAGAGVGGLLGGLPAGFPAAQANGFDGEIEIHQE